MGKTNLDIFRISILGKKLPIDTIKLIETYYDIIIDNPICSSCPNMNLNYYDYIDGVGYICPQCMGIGY